MPAPSQTPIDNRTLGSVRSGRLILAGGLRTAERSANGGARLGVIDAEQKGPAVRQIRPGRGPRTRDALQNGS